MAHNKTYSYLMSNSSTSMLRVFILILVSLCITTKSMAMVAEFETNKTATMSTHCMEMMGDVQTSDPEDSSHHDKGSCGNHYACLGLELKSTQITLIAVQVELNAKQPALTYFHRINHGYFALPDPPPRYIF